MSDSSILIRRGIKPGIAGFFTGAGSVLWGLSRILGDARLRVLAVVPLLLTGVLYLVLAAVAFWQGPSVLDWVRGSLGLSEDVWWQATLLWIAVIFAVLGLLVLMALLFTTVAEAVGGPFYDKMAMHILRGHSIDTREPGLIEGTVPDLIRSILFVIPAVICWFLGLIPVIGIAFWVLGAVVVSLGFASAAINPALIVTGRGLGARVGFVFEYFFTMLGIGGVVAVSMLVPLVGLAAIPCAIVGATELFARARVQDTV